MRYATFWRCLQTVAGLDKLASSTASDKIAAEAGVILAEHCDYLFGHLKQANLFAQMMEFRAAHQVTGAKLAASTEETADLLQKLATAVYVDDVITDQLSKLSGTAYDEARLTQKLGREYAVNLMRGLLA